MGRDASNSGDDRRVQMVRRQIKARGVRDPRVLSAMREVPRERFIPEGELQWAFDDHPLSIGRGQTISQPYIVALMTEALKIRPEHQVLEIGAGSGYQSAVLARLCRTVCALERDAELAGRARATLEDLGVENVDLRCGDGFCGWPEKGVEFDGILVACAADDVPQALLDQLRTPGRMVLPLGEGLVQDLCLIERTADGDLLRRSLGYVRFVPMVPGLEEGERRAGFPTRHLQELGGQECPPSVARAPFFDPDAETDKHRRNLPHWQQGEAWIFATWRLDDSLPKAKLDQWKEERAIWLSHHPEPWDEKTEAEYHDRFSGQIDEWLDQGSGSCVLKDPGNAKIVADALRHFDGQRYELGSFVVMPNHVHVLFRPLVDHTLPEILKSWKGFTAREINKRLGKTGPLWQDEYWDRLIRNERHFFKVAKYIRENPGKAKLKTGEFVLGEKNGLSSLLNSSNDTGRNARAPL